MKTFFELYPKSVLITKDGLKYVSNITEEDVVLMGNKSFEKISQINKSTIPLLSIKGHGHPQLMVSNNQKILVTNYDRVLNKETEKTERKFYKPHQVLAKDTKGMFWASPVSFPKEICPIELNENILWLIGAYLGNGYVNYNNIYFGTNHFRCDELEEKLSYLNIKLNKNQKGAIVEYYINHAVLADWLKRTLNVGYNTKNIPFWIYGMDEKYRKSFFDGFVWGNGVFENESYRFSIKDNKYLAIGIKLIAQTLGYSTALYLSTSKKRNKVTERWQIVAEINARSSVVIEENRFGLIREVTEKKRNYVVYNIEIENGNSLIVDGILLIN